MSRQYFVIAKETCPRCGGDGIDPESEKLPIPFICPDCQGNRFIEDKVSLAEALADLTITIDQG